MAFPAKTIAIITGVPNERSISTRTRMEVLSVPGDRACSFGYLCCEIEIGKLKI